MSKQSGVTFDLDTSSVNDEKRTNIGRYKIDSISANNENDADNSSCSSKDELLLDAFKHEALRRRAPLIWLPRDELGIALDEIAHMPENVHADCANATLTSKGSVKIEQGCVLPDYVQADNILL